MPRDVADDVGCSSSYVSDTTNEIFVEAVGKCTFNGEELRLLTFASGRDQLGPEVPASLDVNGPLSAG